MFAHLQYKGPNIAVKSPAGKQAEDILDFNDPDSVDYRQLVIDLITGLERDVREHNDTIKAIEDAMNREPHRALEFQSEIQAARASLARIQHNLDRISGGDQTP